MVWLAYQSFSAVTFAEISKARLALLNKSTRRGFDFITGVTGTAYALASNRELSSLLETADTASCTDSPAEGFFIEFWDHTMVVSEGITSIELYTDAFNEVTVTMADRIFPVDTIAHNCIIRWKRLMRLGFRYVRTIWPIPGRMHPTDFRQSWRDGAYVLIRLSRADIVRRFADVPMVLDGKVLLVDPAGDVVMQMGRVDPAGEKERADRRNEASKVQETGGAVNSSLVL